MELRGLDSQDHTTGKNTVHNLPRRDVSEILVHPYPDKSLHLNLLRTPYTPDKLIMNNHAKEKWNWQKRSWMDECREYLISVHTGTRSIRGYGPG